jgi:hypothetical protein
MGVLALLDGAPAQPDEAWCSEVRQSLAERPTDWLDAVRDAGLVGEDRAWALLSWIEVAATELARDGSRSLLESAAFAIGLLEASDLDPRDVGVVASLLRRGAELAEVDFADSVVAGCERAAEFGASALSRLLSVRASTPATHAETGEGQSFSFVRRPIDFDVKELERWLEGGP